MLRREEDYCHLYWNGFIVFAAVCDWNLSSISSIISSWVTLLRSSSPLQNAFQSVKGPLRWCLPWRSLFSRNWRMTDVCKIAFFSLASIPFEPWEFKHFSVWKSQKKSHSTLRAYTFWVDKSLLKMPKMVHFGEFFENLKLAVKQCYQTGQF